MALASGTGPTTPHSEGSDCAASCKESRLMWGGGRGLLVPFWDTTSFHIQFISEISDIFSLDGPEV